MSFELIGGKGGRNCSIFNLFSAGIYEFCLTGDAGSECLCRKMCDD